MATDPSGLDAEHKYAHIDYLTQWRMPRANAAPGSCDESPAAAARSVSVRKLILDDIDGIFTYLDISAGLAHGNKALDFSGRNVFSVETDSYHVPASKAWLVLLPFAWALDVILWPCVLYMWTSYAGAH